MAQRRRGRSMFCESPWLVASALAANFVAGSLNLLVGLRSPLVDATVTQDGMKNMPPSKSNQT